jgi:hypothetical protein
MNSLNLVSRESHRPAAAWPCAASVHLLLRGDECMTMRSDSPARLFSIVCTDRGTADSVDALRERLVDRYRVVTYDRDVGRFMSDIPAQLVGVELHIDDLE